MFPAGRLSLDFRFLRSLFSMFARRAFSTSAACARHVSHIGSKPIQFPPAVSFTQTESALGVTGPLGTTAVALHPFVKIAFPEPNVLSLSVDDAEIKVQRQMWGTTRTLIQNAIVGMSKGFTIPLYLVGVGYRAAIEKDPRGTTLGGGGERFNLKLGFSHDVYVPIPPYIKASVPIPTKIVLSCTDKHLLGLFAAKVREFRKPEPYKGKGIFIGDEKISIKAVKKM